MEKIYGAIVTYNPDISNLERNIFSIMKQVDRLIVFDNNSTNKADIKEIQNRFDFEAIYSDQNLGLGKAYNDIILTRLDLCAFFVTFDQDTYISEDTVDTLLHIIESNPQVGVMGPVFSRLENFVHNNGTIHFVDVIIQSCAVFRSAGITKTGGFNEGYFIDSLDFEYCLRLLQNGFKVAKYDGVCIQHELGVPKSFMGIKYYSHNNLRNYYIARNHMDITRRFYQTFSKFVMKKNFFLFLHFLQLIILERDSEKIKYFMKGLSNKPL